MSEQPGPQWQPRREWEPWRVGSRYGIHVYAGTEGGGRDRPVATFFNAAEAAEAVAAVNALHAETPPDRDTPQA